MMALKRLTAVFLACGACAFGATVRDDTTSGLIREPTTWEGTVKVVGDVIVDNGFKLTIEPGTRVEFQLRYTLEVRGALDARGSETDSIVFTIADTSGYGAGVHRGWRGIRFDHTDTSNDYSFLQYCRLEYGKAEGASPARYGGAVFVRGYSDLAISHCLFRFDTAAYGGAVYLDSAAVDIADCVFESNGAYVGGAVYIYGEDPVIERSLFYANRAEFGGGLYCLESSPDVYNCVFDGNRARTHGGGMYSNTRSWPQVYGCTFVNNAAPQGGGHYTLLETGNTTDIPEIGCSIFWNNGDELGGDDIDVHRCCVMGGAPGQHNITEDPMLRDTAAGDYGLRIGSPCINTGGDPSIGSNDFLGNNRVFDDSTDIGAIEARCEVFNGQYWWNEWWDADTVLVHSSVYVDRMMTLAISPGTVVILDSGTVKVKGSIQATGTESDSIVFMMANRPYGFGGITFDSIPFQYMTDHPSDFEYCRFQGPGPMGRTNGIRVQQCVAPVSFRNCVFTGMSTSQRQPLNVFNSDVSLSDCLFRGNKSFQGSTGGAVSFLRCADTITIERCLFENNEAAGTNASGGALYLSQTNARVSECVFRYNVADILGGTVTVGGLFSGDTTATAHFDRCDIRNGLARNGGAFCGFGDRAVLTNCLLANNSASDNGAALGLYRGTYAAVNCTFAGNNGASSTVHAAGGADFEAVNCVFWNDTTELKSADSGTVTTTYSCVRGDGSGEGNIDVNPAFVDSAMGLFALADTSPVVNRGTPDTAGLWLGEFDLAGNARIMGSVIDMGAYEEDPAVGLVDIGTPGVPRAEGRVVWRAFDLRGRCLGGVDGNCRGAVRGLNTPGVFLLRAEGARSQAQHRRQVRLP